MVENKSKESKTDERKKLFAEISSETKDKIDIICTDEGLKIYELIEKAIDFYDKFLSMDEKSKKIIAKYENQFDNVFEIFKESLRQLHEQKKPKKETDLDWWCKSRELNMMLISNTTFQKFITIIEKFNLIENYIEKEIVSNKEPSKENLMMKINDLREIMEYDLNHLKEKDIAYELIIWYTGKLMTELSVDEILEAIQKLWVIQNYFITIDIKKTSADQYLLTLKHGKNKRYSKYWLDYFKKLLCSKDFPYKILIEEEETLGETIFIKLKHAYKK